MNDEFYIGYADRAGPHTARRIRRLVVGIAAVLLVIAGILASRQTFDSARFEYGEIRAYEGTITTDPYPMLHTDAGETYLLVAFGKAGWPHASNGLRLRLEGTLIERGDTRMLEVVGSGDAVSETTTRSIPVSARRRVVLTGEITGSKCYLGVMNPGRGTTHRACARVCIQGGVPPMLHAMTTDGEERHVLLTGSDIVDRVLPVIAEPVIVRGAIWKTGSQWILDVADLEAVNQSLRP